MNNLYYDILSLLCVIGIIWGIKLMNSPRTATKGNMLGAVFLMVSVALTLFRNGILDVWLLWLGMILGGGIGYYLAVKVTMLKMPQMIALLNGLGGGASALVAIMIMTESPLESSFFISITAILALVVGAVTFSGSMIAAAKLDQRLPQRPIHFKSHYVFLSIAALLLCIGLLLGTGMSAGVLKVMILLILAISLLIGILFTIRVGGADMPITISLLNSLSGLAGAIAGFAIYDPLLVAVGGIVGAAGLILTQVMCKGMNRNLIQILAGKTSVVPQNGLKAKENGKDEKAQSSLEGMNIEKAATEDVDVKKEEIDDEAKAKNILEKANRIIIVPGYGMALAQAQYQVKALYDRLVKDGKEVKFAIHPVAGRMPGHMNVLLAEVDIPYDRLYEMDDVNEEFPETDLVIVIGANDVINPAANTAEGTPIYGMPILNAEDAKNIIIFNRDTNPGYAGVDNPIYEMEKAILLLGDAKETLLKLE